MLHKYVHPGLLVPDIPLEETPEIREVAQAHGLELVLLTTPTTPKERMNAIAQDSQGFVYLVSITGASGTCSGVYVHNSDAVQASREPRRTCLGVLRGLLRTCTR